MPAKQVRQRKIALLGYRSVGKSSLAIQYVSNKFPDNYDPTIEQTYTKSCTVKNQEYYLRILDTSGQDEFSIFSPNYAIDVHGYCLIYSIDSRKSFEVVQAIYEKLMDAAGGVRVPIVLVGNKNDLNDQRMISPEEGEALAKAWGAVFTELSAKQYKKVQDLFENLLVTIDNGGNPYSQQTPTATGGKDSKCSMM